MKTDYNPTDAQLWLKKTTGNTHWFQLVSLQMQIASLGFRLLMIKQEIWR